MSLPQISITFKNLGVSAISSTKSSTIALIVKDSITQGAYVLNDLSDAPVGLSATNLEQVQFAFLGGTNLPTKVILFVLPTNATDYTVAHNYLETVKFDIIAYPTFVVGDTVAVTTWVKRMRDQLGRRILAVLPNVNADYEGIINFTTTDIKAYNKTFTTAQYCVRIASLIGGTPLQISTTYKPLPEVTDCQRLTQTDLATKIGNGEFVIFHDGEKVKVGRGVTSHKTVTQQKGEDYKSIKVVETLDLIYTDIKKAFEDTYIGNYANNYDNKLLLISAIQGYLYQQEQNTLLDEGKNTVEIDVIAQKNYLKTIGIDVSTMTDQEIKEANTKKRVFLGGKLKVVDAIEDIDLVFSL